MMIPQWGRHAVTLALMTLAPAHAAVAQDNPPVPETRPLLLGPVELHPLIALRDVGVESNVYSEPTAGRSDFTYTITPRLHTLTNIGSSRFTAIGLADVVYYRQYEDQRSLNASLGGRYEMVDGRLRPFVAAGYSRARERGIEIEARTEKTSKRVSAGIDVELTAATALTAWANHERFLIAPDELYDGVQLANQLNHSTDTIAAGARFQVTPLTTIVTAVEMLRDRFDHEPFRDSDMLRIAPAVEFDPSALISGRAQAGFRQFSPVNGTLHGQRGFMGSFTLGSTLNRAHVEFQGNHDIAYSYDITQPYYLLSGGRVNLSIRVAGPFEIIGLAERWSTRNQRVGEQSFDGRHEQTTDLGGGVGFQLSKQLRLTLTHTQRARTSSESIYREYERTRTVGSVSYGL